MCGTGTCAVKQLKGLMKANLLDPADPHAHYGPELPSLLTGLFECFRGEMVGEICLGALLQLPLADTGQLCRNRPQVPLTEYIPHAEIKQTQNAWQWKIPCAGSCFPLCFCSGPMVPVCIGWDTEIWEWHSKTDFGASDLLSRGYRGCGEETLINCVEKSLEQM